MAYTKKTVDAAKTSKQVIDDKTLAVNESNINDMPTVRKFEQEDLIPCRSMVSGQLFIEGARSKLLYTFADYNDVCDIEYRDLIYMVRTYNNRFVYEPWIIIEDEDFIAQNPKLAELYESMYTNSDLIEILNMPATEMGEYIKALPIGCKNAIKGVAATMIDNGSLDSVQKIKVLDEIFGTNMLLTLVQE